MTDSAPPSIQTIVLIGFMGCGKSCAARRLAHLLNWPSVDLDHEIEAQIGTTISEFFSTHGESVFRSLETRHLRRVLRERGIVSTGGGIVTREENRVLLQEAQRDGATSVIYLRAKPETLTTRIRRQPGVRPLIDGERVLDWPQTRERVRFLLNQRSHFYEECADFIVDSDQLAASQVARIIAAYIAP